MARQDETTAVLDVWQEAKDAGDDPIRVLLQGLLQRLLEEEMTAHLGAEPYERTQRRRGHRNGYKPRTLKTRVGRLEMMVPKDRQGRFRTEGPGVGRGGLAIGAGRRDARRGAGASGGAGRGSGRALPEGGSVAGGGVGGVRPAGTAPQADAFHEHAGTVAPGAEASDTGGADLPERPVVPASGDGAVDGDERGVAGAAVPADGGGRRIGSRRTGDRRAGPVGGLSVGPAPASVPLASAAPTPPNEEMPFYRTLRT